MEFTEDEIKFRKPVWIALSNLFLDTDVSLNYKYIVRACSESKYSIDELKGILENEVAPVVSINLWSVAGEWSGFDEKWLVRSICQNTKKVSIIPDVLKNKFKNIGSKSYIKEHWNNILPKINKARANA